jgi:hypothetical protein
VAGWKSLVKGPAFDRQFDAKTGEKDGGEEEDGGEEMEAEENEENKEPSDEDDPRLELAEE